ncbi:uncharacterized protein EV154DRAFT_583435 [Mucor mucedo]|uniref:uncharacterized protein n=1 Tax=Mucor mucedo TaxID=29922 RepID=UPI00221EE044|nr:uncharacterized protein EV154DRAFT_583435 [Mucor mucedo]KAI7866909.1 hypothetical protein EV154DRAFT_583435 [Mucor mucedo]
MNEMVNQTNALLFKELIAESIRFEDLNEGTKSYFRHTTSTLVYMSICLTCTVWQVLTAGELAYKVRKWLHFAVLFETFLSFISILCSILNPLTALSCEFRFWVSIICVNLGGCCIQTILLYKAYICYDRSTWLLLFGSFINLGYIALTFIYATLGKVPTYKDLLGNCVMQNLEWPALAKLGLDIASNVFLSFAFLMVIYRHYKIFGNSLHKSLLSSGMIFSVGVILSNIVTAILISCRVMGGLSADLYSFDWVITSYLLIKQFKMSKTAESTRTDEEFEETATKTMQSLTSSFEIPVSPLASSTPGRKGSHPLSSRHSTGVMSETTTVHPGQDYMDHFPLSPSDDQKPFRP